MVQGGDNIQQQTDMAIYRLNQPRGADSVKILFIAKHLSFQAEQFFFQNTTGPISPNLFWAVFAPPLNYLAADAKMNISGDNNVWVSISGE